MRLGRDFDALRHCRQPIADFVMGIEPDTGAFLGLNELDPNVLSSREEQE